MKISEALVHSGMENVEDHDYWWTCNYKGNEIYISKTNGNCDWNTFSLRINDKQITTRCNYRTLIQKIKTYI